MARTCGRNFLAMKVQFVVGYSVFFLVTVFFLNSSSVYNFELIRPSLFSPSLPLSLLPFLPSSLLSFHPSSFIPPSIFRSSFPSFLLSFLPPFLLSLFTHPPLGCPEHRWQCGADSAEERQDEAPPASPAHSPQTIPAAGGSVRGLQTHACHLTPTQCSTR